MPTDARSSSLLPILLSGWALACDPGRGSVDPEPSHDTGPVCTGADGLARAWSRASRDGLEAALEQLPGEWPNQLLASLDAGMPEHIQRWTESHRQACERGQPVVLRCLDRRAWQLDAVLALIVEKPERAATLWSELERGAADPRGCERATGDALPELDRARGRELESLALLLELGEFSRVDPIVAELAADPVLAGAPGYAVWLELARAEVELAGDRVDAAEQALARAAELAEGLDAGARTAVSDTRALVALARGDVEASERAREQAVTHAREQADPWLLVAQLREQGRARVEQGRSALAVAPLVEAIGLSGRLGGADYPRTAELQTILAQAQLELGQTEAAHDTLIQARDTLVIALGPDHPQTLATVEAVGRLFVAVGRPGDAQFAFLDLLEVYTDLYGVKDWRTARIKLELADSLMAVDQHDGARTLYTEALTPLAQELGPVHPDVVRTSIHLGIAELALGNLDAAEPHCSRGRDLAKALAPDSPLADEAERCLTQLAASRAAAKNKQKR